MNVLFRKSASLASRRTALAALLSAAEPLLRHPPPPASDSFAPILSSLAGSSVSLGRSAGFQSSAAAGFRASDVARGELAAADDYSDEDRITSMAGAGAGGYAESKVGLEIAKLGISSEIVSAHCTLSCSAASAMFHCTPTALLQDTCKGPPELHALTHATASSSGLALHDPSSPTCSYPCYIYSTFILEKLFGKSYTSL